MSSTLDIYIDGTKAETSLLSKMSGLEVEENADLPGAIQFTLPVDRTEAGELSYISDPEFQPLTPIAIVATSYEALPECIFDGVVLSQKLHLQRGIVSSTVKVSGQDFTWTMNQEEKAKEWPNMTDSIVAASVFSDYGVTPSPTNSTDDSPMHTEQGHTLMQRATDAQFLRDLARRSGKLFRVASANSPDMRIGYFSRPVLDASPAVTLELNNLKVWNIAELDIEWDVSRPTEVKASQKLFSDKSASGVNGDATGSGLPLLGERDLATFAGESMTVMLTAPVDDAGELSMRAKAVLTESEWFVRCETEADVSKLKMIPRVGQLAEIIGVGSVHSGLYYIWSVRHSISVDVHNVRLTLVRNALGPAPEGTTGLEGLF